MVSLEGKRMLLPTYFIQIWKSRSLMLPNISDERNYILLCIRLWFSETNKTNVKRSHQHSFVAFFSPLHTYAMVQAHKSHVLDNGLHYPSVFVECVDSNFH